jgi:hypothetical protein
MIREDLSLRQAAQQLGVEISPQHASNITSRIRFQEALDEARLEYFTEIGSNPRLTKEAVVGQLYLLACRMAADREDAKAADALLKLSKIQGWLGYEPDSPFKVLHSLNQSELDQLKQRILDQKQTQQQVASQTQEAGSASTERAN